jgi:glycosyltransferase involved in cell wall biosynthesis
VFVLPSASENFGVAVVEAMNAGLPVIVAPGAGLAELVQAAGAGIVSDDSVEGLESALARLLADSSLGRAMGEAGRRAVKEELSLETCGSRLEALYRAVAHGAALSAPAALSGSAPP